MKIKIFSFLFLITLFTSCNKYSREKYPQLISKTESHKYINSCYSTDFENLDKIPTDMRNRIIIYLKNRVGNNNFQKLEFDRGYVLSDKPIEIETTEEEKKILALLGPEKEKTDCDTVVAFPVYSVVYQFRKPEIGIKNIRMNLMIDRNSKIIKDIHFPKIEFIDKIIPIDSVHSELIRRKISYKKLNIKLLFDKRNRSMYWTTSTLIRGGSIMGPSCYPEVEYHFKMNANNGKVTEFNYEKKDEFFVGTDIFH